MKVLIFASTVLFASLTFAADRELVMTSPDSARVTYADKCSNGANIDKATREKFIANMLKDPKSQLAQQKAALLAEIGDDARGEGVYLTVWTPSFHDRDGCGDNRNSYSAILVTVTGGNTNHTVSRYLVTVDDDDHSGERILKLRSIQPLSVRDEQ